MKNIGLYTMLLLVLCIAGCKKDKDETPPFDVIGTWRVATASPTDAASYYQFTADKYLYILDVDKKGWKGLSKGLYQFSDGQLITSFASGTFGSSISNNLYNIEQRTDTIILSPGSLYNDDIVLIKDNLAPKSVGTFITPLQPTASFEDTAKVQSLTYYNGKLYGVKGNSKLLLYGISDKRVVEVRNLDNSYDAIEFDYAGNLWAVNYSIRMYKLNPLTGNMILNSVASSDAFRTIAYDGIYWLGASTANGNIQKYYAQTDEFAGSYAGNYYIDELGYGADHGYAVEGGVIHRFTGSFSNYEKAYYIEGYNCKSIAYDNSNNIFWVGAENQSDGKYYMLQVQFN